MKYLMFNKALDYQRSYLETSEYDGNSLTISDGESHGIMISRLLDSREKGTVWHRMVMDGESLGDTSIQFTIYASDTNWLVWKSRKTDITALIRDSGIPTEDKKKAFLPYLAKRVLNPADILLHEIQGRYLWFIAELFGQGNSHPLIRTIKIYFPKSTWIGWLPGVYQNNPESVSFLERYLGIFQSIYDDMEQNIRHSARYMDPDAGPEEFLLWCASWLKIGNTYLWTEEKLRKLLRCAARLFSKRGTREGLLELVELYTGQKPWIIETCQTEEFARDGYRKMALERLYGSDDYVCCLLVKEECISSAREFQALMAIVREAAPAHMEVRIAVLKPFLYLGEYSYLGINSGLGHYRPLALDGRSLLPFASVGSRDPEEESK